MDNKTEFKAICLKNEGRYLTRGKQYDIKPTDNCFSIIKGERVLLFTLSTNVDVVMLMTWDFLKKWDTIVIINAD